jgi:aminopeptidase
MPTDLRTQKLAKLAVNHCVFVKKGERVIISGGSEAEDFITALYKEVVIKGAFPIVKMSPKGVQSFFYNHAQPHQIEGKPFIEEFTIRNSHKYIGIDTEFNTRELAECDSEKISARAKITKPLINLICNNKPNMHRVTIAYPCQALAQEAEMSLTDYENFVYSACLQDWKKLGNQMDKILARFQQGKLVHLIGEGVDLKFEVNGKQAATDKGEENMPGGEVFMAPIRESLNGYIRFDYPPIRNGREVPDIELTFKDGRVVEFNASQNKDVLEAALGTDENARYVGEFGIGCNPGITRYTKNLLFDEKIGGTIHLALGDAYVMNGGGNDSAVHWDIVKDMTKAKIVLDGKVVQENGKWKI